MMMMVIIRIIISIIIISSSISSYKYDILCYSANYLHMFSTNDSMAMINFSGKKTKAILKTETFTNIL